MNSTLSIIYCLFPAVYFWKCLLLHNYKKNNVHLHDQQYILSAKIREIILNFLHQFSRSVVSNSLRPHESQHTRPPCPSPTPRVHSNSCPSNPLCHPAISSSVIPFSSCPQSLPASESFPMSQLFT